jgi:SWI/SNF-related matrix-associated actin-dependent regulator of chromatin subfamily A3
MMLANQKLTSHCTSYGGDDATFSIEFEPTNADLLFLKFPDGTKFASVNTLICKAFIPLLAGLPIRLEANVNIPVVRDRIRQAKKADDATVRVSVNVYGPRISKDHIGRELSKSKVWLQKPDQWKPGMAYENPQFLTFDGLELQTVSQPVPVEHSKKELLKDPDEFKRAVSDVYANLRRDDNLQQVEKDSRVTTTLLP